MPGCPGKTFSRSAVLSFLWLVSPALDVSQCPCFPLSSLQCLPSQEPCWGSQNTCCPHTSCLTEVYSSMAGTYLSNRSSMFLCADILRASNNRFWKLSSDAEETSSGALVCNGHEGFVRVMGMAIPASSVGNGRVGALASQACLHPLISLSLGLLPASLSLLQSLHKFSPSAPSSQNSPLCAPHTGLCHRMTCLPHLNPTLCA